MLNFLKKGVEKRWVNFKGDEPVAVFFDKTDAFFYMQYHPLYCLDEINCVFLPRSGYVDKENDELSIVRIILKRAQGENSAKNEVELWCSGSFAEGAIYAYAYHVCKNGGSINDFEVEMTVIDLFDFNDENYTGDIKRATVLPMIKNILSCVNENNYQLACYLLEYCYEGQIYDLDGLIESERKSFTYLNSLFLYLF